LIVIMKRIFLFIALVTLASFGMAQKMGILLDYKSYCTDKLEPYIEFSFLIDGQSVHYVKNKNNLFQAQIEILVEIVKEGTAINNLHFILNSDEFSDSIQKNKPDFLTVKNLKIPNGEYFLNFTLKDINSPQDSIVYKDMIQLYFPENKVSISSISLLSDFKEANGDNIYNKYGFTMIPLYFDYAPQNLIYLPYMIEIYNSAAILGEGEFFFVKSYLEWYDTGTLMTNHPIYFEKKQTDAVVIVLQNFNIYKLYSGNYNLVVEILDADSNILASSRAFFQRNNPAPEKEILIDSSIIPENNFAEKFTDLAELREYLSMLAPICNPTEQIFLKRNMKNTPIEQLQRFFYTFWQSRNNQAPEEEWKKYKANVDLVQNLYGSKVVKGYKTDRGRVYLKYGKPTQVLEVPYDPQAYPYEIWTYYVLGNQTNVKFVFYDRDLATNEYELLHSDAYGEVRNLNWQMELTKRLHPTINPDIKVPDDYWGGEINDNWRLNR